MRGFLHPAVQHLPSDAQKAFGEMPRSRRSKLAAAASTTLVKADQWARGGAVPADVNDALDQAMAARAAKAAKKK